MAPLYLWYISGTAEATNFKFGTGVTHGQVPRVNLPKMLFGENLQLKPMESISAYFLTTDKAIITKLCQNIKHIELYKKCKIWGQKGRDLGHVTYF